jgi:hypothetical protein
LANDKVEINQEMNKVSCSAVLFRWQFHKQKKCKQNLPKVFLHPYQHEPLEIKNHPAVVSLPRKVLRINVSIPSKGKHDKLVTATEYLMHVNQEVLQKKAAISVLQVMK